MCRCCGLSWGIWGIFCGRRSGGGCAESVGHLAVDSPSQSAAVKDAAVSSSSPPTGARKGNVWRQPPHPDALPQGGEGESLAAERGEGVFRWNHEKTAFFCIYGRLSDFPVTFQSYGTSCHSLPMKRESFPMPRHSLPAASHRLPVTWESFLTRWDCLPSSWRRLPAAWEDYRTAWDSLPMAWNRLPAAWEDYRTAWESNGASPADDETSRGSHCEFGLESQ